MKALSIQQPWAYCITNGTKRVENRTWYTSYRGLVLIHAGKRYQNGMEHAIHSDSPEVDIVGMLRAPRGALVGVAYLYDCVRPDQVDVDQQIWAGGPWCFLLGSVYEFSQPVPYDGALRFFDVPDSVVAHAMSRLQGVGTWTVPPGRSAML